MGGWWMGCCTHLVHVYHAISTQSDRYSTTGSGGGRATEGRRTSGRLTERGVSLSCRRGNQGTQCRSDADAPGDPAGTPSEVPSGADMGPKKDRSNLATGGSRRHSRGRRNRDHDACKSAPSRGRHGCLGGAFGTVQWAPPNGHLGHESPRSSQWLGMAVASPLPKCPYDTLLCLPNCKENELQGSQSGRPSNRLASTRPAGGYERFRCRATTT